jgi:hypothetical protein
MADVDIGSPAIDRAGNQAITYTRVEKGNPANDNGTITSVEIWAYSDLSGCEIATFIDEGSNVLSTRDYETIGSVTSGSKQTFSGLDMDVQTGDYIGIHGSGGNIEDDWSGGAGQWMKSGDYIPCSSETFNSYANFTLSLYGEGGPPSTEKTSSDTGSGVDAKASGNPIATLVKSETGSGADDVVSLQTPAAKSSSDAGSGVEDTPMQAAALAGSESGSGSEALIARFLAVLDTGTGAEASEIGGGGLFKELFATELGEGSDCLIAKIEMPTKGGGMRLWT